MRTLEALKKLAAKLTSKQESQVTGDTVDEVIDFAANNFKAESATNASVAWSLVLTSPDESVWDITIANDGTISGTKRTD